MMLKCLIVIPAALTLCAQTPKPKDVSESQLARKTFQQVLDAVGDGWFGKPYQAINAVDLQGTLGITLTPQALNTKVDQLSQGQIKGELTKGGVVNMKLKGTYFANSDFRTELAGDFGNLLYTRVSNRGFLYSKEQNAYTTKVDPPPADAPLSFMGWFRQTLNDIKAVYIDGNTFKASLGKEEAISGKSSQTVTFIAPTSAYDPKKREQSLAESLGFWKRGRLEVTFDKTTRLPQRMNFSNEAQGVSTLMEFSYGGDGRLQSVNVDNQSRGAQGPAALRLTYGGDGLINHIAGTLNSQKQNIAFDMGLTWNKGKKTSSIISVPPPGAAKKGGDEMKTLLAVADSGAGDPRASPDGSSRPCRDPGCAG
jgi:hypothetical protein